MSVEKYVKVETNANEFKIKDKEIPLIYLTQPAENGKANSELINKLKTVLGVKPGIVSGHKSRRKKIIVNLNEEEFNKKIKEGVTK